MTKHYFDNILDELNAMYGFSVYKMENDKYLWYDKQEETFEIVPLPRMIKFYIDAYNYKLDFEESGNDAYKLFTDILNQLKGIQ